MSSPVNETSAGSHAARETQPLVIIVMGVSGCGKSTVARYIANGLQEGGLSAHYKDGDELHPPANIEKMSTGMPLADEDRQPWLEQVAHYARGKALEHGICVIACSALKQQYRNTLNTAGRVVYIFLQGSQELIASRMHERTGHFMPETLLDSQFAALEDPRDEPHVITVNIDTTPETVAIKAIERLKQDQYLPH